MAVGPIYRTVPVTDKFSQQGEDSRLAYGLCGMMGWRLAMEDAASVDLNMDGRGGTAFFCVCDGHGGDGVAHFCAKNLASIIRETDAFAAGKLAAALHEAFLRVDPLMVKKVEEAEPQIYDALDESDDEMHDAAARAQQKRHSAREYVKFDEEAQGTTAAVALLRNAELYVAGVGDTRCICCHSGAAIDLTVDHKPDDPAELARITGAGGSVRDGRLNGDLNLSRSLGDVRYKKDRRGRYSTRRAPEALMMSPVPHVATLRLEPGDEFLLLACDGIFEALSSQQAVEFVGEQLRGGASPELASKALCDRCLAPSFEAEVGSRDNMTCIVIALKDFAGDEMQSDIVMETEASSEAYTPKEALRNLSLVDSDSDDLDELSHYDG